jgi:hypothetical protein
MFKLTLAAGLLLLPTLAVAADLRVTDSRGTEVVVRNASIDYPAGIAAVRESNGIRVLQGEGTVTVKWNDVQSLSLRGGDGARAEIDVVMRDGRHVTAALPKNGDATLRGRTELGDYSIRLDKVRSIEPLRER